MIDRDRDGWGGRRDAEGREGRVGGGRVPRPHHNAGHREALLAAAGLELPHVSESVEGGTSRVAPERRIAAARVDVPLGAERFVPAN